MSYEVKIFSETDGPKLDYEGVHGGVEPRFMTQGIVWTEPLVEGSETPDLLIINSKAARHTYRMPRLVWIRGRSALYTVLTDRGPSGTVTPIEKLYVLISHNPHH